MGAISFCFFLSAVDAAVIEGAPTVKRLLGVMVLRRDAMMLTVIAGKGADRREPPQRAAST